MIGKRRQALSQVFEPRVAAVSNAVRQVVPRGLSVFEVCIINRYDEITDGHGPQPFRACTTDHNRYRQVQSTASNPAPVSHVI